jgi:hypothetical protein
VRLVPLVGWALLTVGGLLSGLVAVLILPGDRIGGFGALLALGTVTITGGIVALLLTAEPETNGDGIVLRGGRLVPWQRVLSYRHIAPTGQYWYISLRYKTPRGSHRGRAIVLLPNVGPSDSLSPEPGRDATVLDQYIPEKRLPRIRPVV